MIDLQIILNLLLNFWAIVINPIILFYVFWEARLDYIQTRFINSTQWALFEIRIPKEIGKTTRAMEQVITALYALYDPPDKIEKNIKGQVQLWASLEIVGKGGNIHFYIRTPAKYRNLVESQIYAQYPAVEIEEVGDYVNDTPSDIPNENYDFFGTEFKLLKPDAYPIKTYTQFEISELQEEIERIDPLANMVEVLSRTKEGEQIWIQYLIKPAGEGWKKEGEKLRDKIIGRKAPVKRGAMSSLVSNIIDAIIPGPPPAPPKKDSPPSIMSLSPGEREVCEAIEKNISKIGFFTKIRFMYLAPTSIFDGGFISAIVGAFDQYNTLNLNGFKINKKTATKIKYILKKSRVYYRKKKILAKYKKRDFYDRRLLFLKTSAFVLNTEEIATLYHYPGLAVPALTMPRVDAKTGGAPMGLPVE